MRYNRCLAENHTQQIIARVGRYEYVQIMNFEARDVRNYHGSLTS